MLVVNADDWGRDRDTTARIGECVRAGGVSSVSAMVFMEDSERAAAVARESGIDAGLHLNFTSRFSAPGCPARLVGCQDELAAWLLGNRFARIIFHPRLGCVFEYVIAAQIDEFRRLYGTEPTRIDGHHHMHLCSNVLFGGLLPAGAIVRRNFFFRPGEKSFLNRFYRRTVDRILARRHRLTDFLFSLPVIMRTDCLEQVVSLARTHSVEVETHPVNHEEYRFLTEGGISRHSADVPIARGFAAALLR